MILWVGPNQKGRETMIDKEVRQELYELFAARRNAPRQLLDDVQVAGKEEEYQIEIPDHNQTVLHQSTDHEYVNGRNGVTYQRCGGGRRVIRRSQRNY